jgi:hypothetical protein
MLEREASLHYMHACFTNFPSKLGLHQTCFVVQHLLDGISRPICSRRGNWRPYSTVLQYFDVTDISRFESLTLSSCTPPLSPSHWDKLRATNQRAMITLNEEQSS